MNEEFIKSIYKTLVVNGRNMYQDMFENTVVNEQTIDYWKKAMDLYFSFDDKQKNIFFDIIQQIIIDTISINFGVLDGICGMSGENFEFDVKINGISTEAELQDTFLGYIEDNVN